MPISFAEAIDRLLKGSALAWPKVGSHKAGEIVLETAGARRLFDFLLRQASDKVLGGDESLFPGLIAAWEDDQRDPAAERAGTGAQTIIQEWRLHHIQAHGFGGLTLLGGPTFDLRIDGVNWVLEGQNGSGKTSLASAIMWALTGLRIRDQAGPIEESGVREPVLDGAGARLGTWPPLVAYPMDATGLAADSEAWVRLTFVSRTGETATAYRRLSAPASGAPVIEAEVDPRLLVASPLIDTGLLMPCRLAHMGFGERSHSLYSAVKALTGLDQLADIGEGVANQLTHAGRKFLKFAKDQGIGLKEVAFRRAIEAALKAASHLGLDISGCDDFAGQDVVRRLRDVAARLTTDAGSHLGTLKDSLSSDIDITTPQGRATVRQALERARVIMGQGTTEIPTLAALKALTTAATDAGFASLPAALAGAEHELERALHWHKAQEADRKLRLKAVAAPWFNVETEAACPLCEGVLATPDQQALARELAELRAEAGAAERKLADVCARLETELRRSLPKELLPHLPLLAELDPRQGLTSAILARFADQPPFSTILVGAAKLVRDAVAAGAQALPPFIAPVPAAPPDQEETASLWATLGDLRRVLALAAWWGLHRQAFVDFWSQIIGKGGVDGTYPADSLHGHIDAIDLALAKAEPFDEAARYLIEAAEAAEAWQRIQAEQLLREQIRDALLPLKDLQVMVAAETAGSLAALSERIDAVLARIHLNERLNFRHAAVGKKVVQVYGGFAEDMKIDATLVANTSWLRAILWAFILALREATIESLGANPFPLMLFDDPQTTFDPRNKRKWAEELARLGNLDPAEQPMAAQIILTTHGRDFFVLLTEVEKLSGQQGMIAPVNAASERATVVNGNNLQRIFHEAETANNDAKAREYIRQVRIYAECLLKHMLRGEGSHVPGSNLDRLRNDLKKLREEQHVAPFTRQAFGDLLNALGGGTRPIKLINDPPHSDDESIGLAQARDVHEYWERMLRPKLHAAFDVFAAFEAHHGDPRTFTHTPTVITLPEGQRDHLAKLTFLRAGRAAAALTEGRAGDGELTLQEWDSSLANPVHLYNMEIYRLLSSTLEPVANPGDFVIVARHKPVNARNLVVAAVGDRLLARRYNEVESHPDIAILTGQSPDPSALPEPVIMGRKGAEMRKIVAIIYASDLPLPPAVAGHEVQAVTDSADYTPRIDKARIFQVQGRSAEPIALDGQFIITGPAASGEAMLRYDGRSVVALDANGTAYFKRLRLPGGELAILESLNPDGTCPAELLSLAEDSPRSQLVQVRPVVGVLFED